MDQGKIVRKNVLSDLSENMERLETTVGEDMQTEKQLKTSIPGYHCK